MTGRLEITNEGTLCCDKFALNQDENRFEFCVEGAKLDPGAFGTIVTVRAENPFSFFVRDINAKYPVYIREYEVIVTEGCDKRGYEEIVADIAKGGRMSELERLENQPEESFESACKKTRSMRVPIWLGLSRDVRMFEVAPHQVVSDSQLWDSITPYYHHTPVQYKEMGDVNVRFDYFAGRGIGTNYHVTRWLEQGVLPILNACSDDGDIKYEHKLFVTNEIAPLTAENVSGTNILVADKYGAWHTPQTPEQEAEMLRLHDKEIFRDDEAVIYLRVEAINTSKAPRYCFMRLPQPNVQDHAIYGNDAIKYENGISSFKSSGRVFMVSTLNGKPFTDVDSSVLLGPGEKAVYICKIPHNPIPAERAEALLNTDFDAKLAECIAFWNAKLDKIADIELPEKRIEEMMKAGFLHLDLVCFGNEPDDAVAPVVGVYTPIGTESTPIIQYIESVGDTELARRAIMYFLKKQRPDGFMQNFQSYMSETGCGLWNAAEHFKYTHDIEWLKSIKDNLIRGCDYIIKWADESRDESLRGRGYGMIYGKVADIEHPFHSYMLNATTYGGLRSVADVLAYIDKAESERIGAFAEEFKANIIESLTETFAVAPVVPLSDGSWVPTASLWPERNMLGLMSQFSLGGLSYTHGSMVIEDANLGGGHYLVTNGVLPADHVFMKFISNVFADMLAVDNAGYSQPYYNLQPYGNILLGQTGAYISEFYNLMSALADRETYTFWEHLYQVSPHKTHEEGWFLMRCRWMLYMDEYGKFDLLGAVPRKWLENGKRISFKGMACRYGRISVNVESRLESENAIYASIRLESNGFECPETISIRLPHPENLRASGVEGGRYCPDCEKVFIDNFSGSADIVLRF